MAGTNYWLAFGGGAARAFVCIGVLRYLEEKNIVISEIAGTSMGAILGAFFAIWKNSYEIEKICQEEKNYLKFADWHFGAGLLKWEKLKQRFQFYFGDTKIENLPIKLKITATSLETGELKIFEKWSLVDALRATTSIPWIFRPYRLGDEHFMDGGMVKNLPVDLLESPHKIAVSALKKSEWPINWKRQIFSWQMKRGFFGLGPQIFTRGITIMMAQNENTSLQLANGEVISLNFEFGDLNGGSFSEVEKLVQLWYEQAKKELNF